MTSLVRQLQHDALDRNVRVSDLLRKALVAARKLGLSEFQTWIQRELDGYAGTALEIPEYRELNGRVRMWNPVRGWIPVYHEDPSQEDRLSKRKTAQAIAQIEDLVDTSAGKGGEFHLPFPSAIQNQLREHAPFDTEFTLFVQRSSLTGILDAVRNIILNWSLQLESDGILGEGFSFTPEERSQAASQQPQNVTNFFGAVHNPQVQQGSPHSSQVIVASEFDANAVLAVLERVRSELDKLGLSSDGIAEAQSEVDTVEVQLRSPKPKPVIIRESLRSIRSILEGAGGGVAAQLAIELGKLLV